MKDLKTLLLFVTIFALWETRATPLAPASDAPASQQPRDASGSYEQGRKIFADNCAKCHDEDAAKKLPDGTTLVQRLAEAKDPDVLAGTRLKKMSAEDRQALLAYLDILIKRYRSAKPNKS